jgi:hypothetical protein
MADRSARPYQVDIHLQKERLNLSLLIDCKAAPDYLRSDQVERYLNTTGTEVILASGISVDRPSEHLVNPVFFVLPEVEPALTTLIAACPANVSNGWGIVRIESQRFLIVHDELSDSELSRSLIEGWEVELAGLPLERLPYDPDAPRWELADVIFRTLMSFFVAGRRVFDLEQLCSSSNELWPFLEAQHSFIRNRVRDEVRTIRRTALKGWLTRVEDGAGREEQWRFARTPRATRNTLASFARRHQRYVSILRSKGDPTADQFVRIDPEQLTLPLIISENAVE